MPGVRVSGHWSDWRPGAPAYTLGVEEELMVLGGQRLQLEPAGPRAAEALPPHLRAVVSVETHASALEVHTSVHERVADAAAELAGLRAELAGELEALGLRAASAGTHPLSLGLDTTVSPQDRYQDLYRALGELARREPTFALHVHVGLPTPEAALRAYDSLRVAVPLLIGLSANSPFWRGRDSGLASARTFVFGAFPRTGLPRAFATYEQYVAALDALIERGRDPRPHVRLVGPAPAAAPRDHRGPRDGRPGGGVGDRRAGGAGAVPGARRGGGGARARPPPPEVLDENRFIAARDGIQARLIDDGRPTPLPVLLDRTLARLAPHAEDLGCVAELEAAADLARENGAARQRRAAEELGVTGIAGALADAYAAPATRDVVGSGSG